MAAREPRPLYTVYRAGDHSVTCYRGISQNPAQVGDFLSFLDANVNFEWWDIPRAMGVSHWDDRDKAAAMARRKGLPLLAEVDLSRTHEKTPWAHTGSSGHITVWAPAPVLIAGIVSYIEV